MPTLNQIKGCLKYYSAPRTKQIKWVWQKLGKMIDQPIVVPANLEGKKIFDPLRGESKQKSLWISPRRHPRLEFLVPPVPHTSHPSYQQSPAFVIDSGTKLELGLDQACLLTNAEYVRGRLPDRVSQDMTALSDKQHNIVVELIKEAFVFDTKKEWLPPKIRYTLPWSFRSGEIGVPLRRKLFNVLDKLLTFALSQQSLLPDTLPIYRSVEYNCPFYINTNLGDDLVHIRRRCQMVTLRALPSKGGRPFASDSSEFTAPSHADLYPMFPTVGLRRRNLYDTGICPGHDPSLQLHCFVMFEETQPLTEMTAEEFVPKMVVHAFGHAQCEAMLRQRNGGDLLGDSIYVLGIGMVEEAFHFVVFELNSPGDKVIGRNRVWIDENNLLLANFPRMTGPVDRIIREANIDQYVRDKIEYQRDTMNKLYSIVNFDR